MWRIDTNNATEVTVTFILAKRIVHNIGHGLVIKNFGLNVIYKDNVRTGRIGIDIHMDDDNRDYDVSSFVHIDKDSIDYGHIHHNVNFFSIAYTVDSIINANNFHDYVVDDV